ncbi:uncharacterized protein DEA37_0009801 [Paragonimus westermani]|uniref:Uncharacterized protein n=1 Tax=Paragonimus westermani TaxID=34504 RepID=A0A5J4P3V6_9TREM|nr:uncharacterized protein DEA37_0009801 [Paragonimus westermani]
MDDLKLLDHPVNSICDQMTIHSRPKTPPSRNTPGGISPADYMFGRKILTSLDNIIPVTSDNEVHRTGCAQCIRRFNIGDSVLVRDFRGQDKWTPAVISKRKGKVIYEVIVGEDTWRRHIDQLRRNPGLLPSKPDSASLHWDILLDTFDLERRADGLLSVISETTPGSFSLRRTKGTKKPINPLQVDPRCQSYDTCRKRGGVRRRTHQNNLVRTSVKAEENSHHFKPSRAVVTADEIRQQQSTGGRARRTDEQDTCK